MAILSLNGKLMEVKLKAGWTATDFAKHFGCTEDEFWQSLQKTFSAKACKDMTARINGNTKQRKKAEKSVRDKSFKVPQLTEVTEIETKSQPGEINEILQVEILLEEMKCKVVEIQQSICEKENLRNQLISQKKKFKEILSQKRDEMLKLKQIIKIYQEEIEDIILKMNELSEEFRKCNDTITDARHLLAEVQQQIKDLEIINLFAYENGEIETGNGVNLIVTGWEQIVKELTINPLFEDLTIKQIKLLSKVLVLVDNFLKEKRHFEVTFEAEEVQNAFDLLMTQIDHLIEEGVA